MSDAATQPDIEPTLAASADELAGRMFDSWRRGDVSTVRAFVVEDGLAWLADARGASGRDPNLGRSMKIGRWLDLLQSVLDRIEGGLGVTVHQSISDNDRFVGEIESRGELDDGRIYNMRYTFWFHIRNGRICELRQYFDTRYGDQFFVDIADGATNRSAPS